MKSYAHDGLIMMMFKIKRKRFFFLFLLLSGFEQEYSDLSDVKVDEMFGFCSNPLEICKIVKKNRIKYCKSKFYLN